LKSLVKTVVVNFESCFSIIDPRWRVARGRCLFLPLDVKVVGCDIMQAFEIAYTTGRFIGLAQERGVTSFECNAGVVEMAGRPRWFSFRCIKVVNSVGWPRSS
jgi:hypothetical protein